MAKVTITSVSYNQKKFIRQALDSFLMQKTDFDFEVIIGDDCSDDGTAEIIADYAKKYPAIIKPIFRNKNIGIEKNFLDVVTRVKSEYVIECESDDCFTDPLKLQKQVDFLDKNPDFSICFHPVRVFFDDGSKKDEIFPTKEMRFNKNILDLNDLLANNFIQTNSCMYRWRFGHGESFEDFYPKNIMPGDYFIHLLHAQKGKIGFIDKVMSAYRKHFGGAWYSLHGADGPFLKYGVEIIRFHLAVDKIIAPESFKYHEKSVIPSAIRICWVYLKNNKINKLFNVLSLVFAGKNPLIIIKDIIKGIVKYLIKRIKSLCKKQKLI